MTVERAPAGTSLIDALDRVLDKGIVMDASLRVSPVAIDLLRTQARLVVASVHTYVDPAAPDAPPPSRTGRVGP